MCIRDRVAAGINGCGNGIMTEEEREETESSVTSALEVAINGVKLSLIHI